MIFALLALSRLLSTPALPVICVDAGHPSEINDGMQKQNGITETHANWAVAGKLRTILERDGYRVVMTKQREYQLVRNVRRAEVANRVHARLMLRLHCDTGAGAGFRVFYPDAVARDGKVIGPPEYVRRESKAAAEVVHDALVSAIGDRLHDNGVATDRSTAVGSKMGGALIGSIHSKVPVVLIEMVFLNNRRDAAFIKTDQGQALFARALAQGVRTYVPRSFP